MIDRTEDSIGGKGIHESTGTVINGFSRESHVVGVHHSVDKTDSHPMGN